MHMLWILEKDVKKRKRMYSRDRRGVALTWSLVLRLKQGLAWKEPSISLFCVLSSSIGPCSTGWSRTRWNIQRYEFKGVALRWWGEATLWRRGFFGKKGVHFEGELSCVSKQVSIYYSSTVRVQIIEKKVSDSIQYHLIWFGAQLRNNHFCHLQWQHRGNDSHFWRYGNVNM